MTCPDDLDDLYEDERWLSAEDWADEPPDDGEPLDLRWWRRPWPIYRASSSGTHTVIRDLSDYHPA